MFFCRVKGENVIRKGALFASALLAGTAAMTIPAFASVGSWQKTAEVGGLNIPTVPMYSHHGLI